MYVTFGGHPEYFETLFVYFIQNICYIMKDGQTMQVFDC